MNNEYTQSFSRQLNQKEKLLTITALSGEFPYSCFGRLNFDENYARRLRSMLYKDGSIRSQWKDGLKGLVLTFEYLTAAKEKKTTRYKYVEVKSRQETSRRYRKHLFALTYCSLINADIEFLPDKKPFVFSRSRQSQSYNAPRPLIKNSLLTDEPIFYSSREIKYELEDYVQQIRNSAMMGLILTRTDCYLLYNIHNNRYPLGFATENKAGILTQNGEFINVKPEKSSHAIMLVDKFETAAEMILGNKKNKIKPTSIIRDRAFRHIYIVPETPDGDIQLFVMCHKDYSDSVDEAFRENYKEGTVDFATINDGFDDEGHPVLNGCSCEITRLFRFKQGLLVNDLTGRILCYDFQMDFIAQIMAPAKIVFNHIKINDIREAIED